MKIIIFSSNFDMIDEFKRKNKIADNLSAYDALSLENILAQSEEKYIVIVDFNSVSSEINKLISLNRLPKYTIILENTPEITSGKMLVFRGAKAYGNTRMANTHYKQMLKAVRNSKVWTYPELTAKLIKDSNVSTVNSDAANLIQNRLSPKEIEVTYLILDGLTNDAIASQLEITTRTAKAHVSAIFSKLHVIDRVSLVLLLK